MHKPKKRPGWYIVEKYMPDAPPEAQEEAYQNLRELVKLLVEIDDRLDQERRRREKLWQPSLFDQ